MTLSNCPRPHPRTVMLPLPLHQCEARRLNFGVSLDPGGMRAGGGVGVCLG